MAITLETARQAIRAWMAIEVLAPRVAKTDWNGLAAEKGGRQRNTRADADDDPALTRPPMDDDATPWPLLAERDPNAGAIETAPEDRPRRWHCVVLGALPARAAFERLDAAFGQGVEEESQRDGRGHIIVASLLLDECGLLAPNSLAIGGFAWGLGHLLGGGDAAGLAEWNEFEPDLRSRISDALQPTGPDGGLRSLTWRDLRGASEALRKDIGLPPELWQQAPCAIETESRDAPDADILSSFYLPDLARALRNLDALPDAAARYLGLRPPDAPWDPLENRGRLSGLLRPELFPLGRWPGPGLHPLTLLQQAAVNAIAGDLRESGLAAVNGPPGTGKTTLLRDIVAHVLVERAETLATLEDPHAGFGQLDLMQYAMVVASGNNAAVENVSLELPVRGKALDASIWREQGLDYFGRTATAVLRPPSGAPEEAQAWGLMAARLGSAANRRGFVKEFWWSEEWGLNDWLNRAAWPDAKQHRDKKPGKLAEAEPPLRRPEALAAWRTARDAFQAALARSRRLRDEAAALALAADARRAAEVALPQAEERLRLAKEDLASAERAANAAADEAETLRSDVSTEAGRLAALVSARPGWIARMLRAPAWRRHRGALLERESAMGAAQSAALAARMRLAKAKDEEGARRVAQATASAARDGLRADFARLGPSVRKGEAAWAALEPGFWSQDDAALLRESPWNEKEFRAARDEVFIAAVRLHRAFVEAAAEPMKRRLNTVVSALSGGAGAGVPTSADWGAFFLLVPVVSTTFASFGRMFRGFGAGEIGWVLIDEAGQASPQSALGAVWRARRSVVIGDPLQIEPVATAPWHTTQLVFERFGLPAGQWAAPLQSAQTLSDRASGVQARFVGMDQKRERMTGMPLLVHRRCAQPMFEIANEIAYGGRMILATAEGPSGIRERLGASAWVDVDGPATGKWVEAEGKLIVAAIEALGRSLTAAPDLYVICPFREPVRRLRALLAHAALPGFTTRKEREARVGTVHAFQGKEAEAVILMLGAGRGAGGGARAWAGGTPNLLNVAATRAKRAFYVVGNRREWDGVGVFRLAAAALPARTPAEWLGDGTAASGSRKLRAPA